MPYPKYFQSKTTKMDMKGFLFFLIETTQFLAGAGTKFLGHVVPGISRQMREVQALNTVN
jgi:hypothetical protein